MRRPCVSRPAEPFGRGRYNTGTGKSRTASQTRLKTPGDALTGALPWPSAYRRMESHGPSRSALCSRPRQLSTMTSPHSATIFWLRLGTARAEPDVSQDGVQVLDLLHGVVELPVVASERVDLHRWFLRCCLTIYSTIMHDMSAFTHETDLLLLSGLDVQAEVPYARVTK